MQHRISPWLLALGVILGLRFFSMVWFPLVDTTEPRYAEISRLMFVTGDWITPWFSPGIPFWGKPPLAFWSEALSFTLLGVNELAVRLPSWLATLGALALIFIYARSLFGNRVARWSLLIYSSCALVYIASGAALMDPFLALATTWAMVSFAMVSQEAKWQWRYGFFAAIAIGLLAKGPLMIVLVAGPLIPLLVLHQSVRETFVKLPWFSGLIVMLVLSAPWYILAELKTPGFLNYFLVGEHFLRFIDSGWKGDLYGTAHLENRGTIWLHALAASLPWGFIALYMLLRHSLNPMRGSSLWQMSKAPHISYLLAWGLFTPIFFTFSGNILWTYVLPSLAAFSILMAIALEKWQEKNYFNRLTLYASVGITPLVATGLMALSTIQPERLKSEKRLVAFAVQHMQPGEKLVFLGEIPFSATFYSQGQAGRTTIEELTANPSRTTTMYLAVPKNDFNQVLKSLNKPLTKAFESRGYVLLVIPRH